MSTTDAIDAETDFEELASRIRTQSADAPGSDTERATIRSFDAVSSETLEALLEAAESESVEPGSLVFLISRANAELLIEREYDIDDVEELSAVLGRPVQVEDGMPDDTIVLLDPAAVDGEELVDPDAIACGIVGSDH
ncbi:hypothetical protein [Halosolutus gelatinilyticus]|uniref:hypothetical protein n=1 Tax=Halosolutus gelatinilyticus TaxID=2931975 RepID=UPI001FF1719D|nr:hypothetical protein [Halosolutus gelatinilyticus]